VVETFLAVQSSQSVPKNYLEVEVSPNSVLFVSKIYNPQGTCQGIEGTLVDCSVSGIHWSAKRSDNENTWFAFLSIPFELIVNASSDNSASENSHAARHLSVEVAPLSVLHGNFFRIDTPSSTGTKEYSCWNPTMASPACFHKPAYFGTLHLSATITDVVS